MSKYWGPYGHGAIVKSLLEYIEGRVIEELLTTHSDNEIHVSAGGWPLFLRTKAGGSEAISHMIFPATEFPEDQYLMKLLPAIPALIHYLDFTNDVLSYYKEHVIHGETSNFVANYSRAHQIPHSEVLLSLTQHVSRVS